MADFEDFDGGENEDDEVDEAELEALFREAEAYLAGAVDVAREMTNMVHSITKELDRALEALRWETEEWDS